MRDLIFSETQHSKITLPDPINRNPLIGIILNIKTNHYKNEYNFIAFKNY